MGYCLRYQCDEGAAIDTVLPGSEFFRTTRKAKKLAPSSGLRSAPIHGRSGAPGYSQSMSTPSRLCSLMKLAMFLAIVTKPSNVSHLSLCLPWSRQFEYDSRRFAT